MTLLCGTQEGKHLLKYSVLPQTNISDCSSVMLSRGCNLLWELGGEIHKNLDLSLLYRFGILWTVPSLGPGVTVCENIFMTV